MKFQENPSNGSQDIDENILSSTSTVPLIIDKSQPNWQCL